MAAMVPLFSANLNMDMTSTKNNNSVHIFHNGTIEMSSNNIDLTPGISRAPVRLERSDITQHKHILDHGEHNRHAVKPPPKKKHPSSQKRMNMTLLNQSSMTGENTLLQSRWSNSHNESGNLHTQQLLQSQSEEKEKKKQQLQLQLQQQQQQQLQQRQQHEQHEQHQQQKPVKLVVSTPSITGSGQEQVANRNNNYAESSNVVERMSRAVTPSLHLRARRAIMACGIIEQDQREAALFSIDRTRTVSNYMKTLRLLLEDAETSQIRTSESRTTHAELTDVDTRSIAKAISGAYKLPGNKRKAAKSVLATATTKVEAVSIQIALLAGVEPIDIIRASDDILHTAVSIDIDEKIRNRLLHAIKTGSTIIDAFVPLQKEQAVKQIIQAKTTSSLLSIIYHLFVHGFDTSDDKHNENNTNDDSAFERVDDESTITERSKGLLIHALNQIANRFISDKQRHAALAALNDTFTMTEACVILVAVMENQTSTVVSEQARSTKDHITEMAELVRTASRASSRGHSSRGTARPSRSNSRPNSRARNAFDQPAQWENNDEKDINDAVSKQVRKKEDKQRRQQQHQRERTQEPKMSHQQPQQQLQPIEKQQSSPKNKGLVDTTATSSNDSSDLNNSDKDADADAERALLAAAKRAQEEHASVTSANAKRRASMAEHDAAIRAQIESADQMDEELELRKTQKALEREQATKRAEENAEAEAQQLATQFEKKVRNDMKNEAEERKRLETIEQKRIKEELKIKEQEEREEKERKEKQEKKEKKEKKEQQEREEIEKREEQQRLERLEQERKEALELKKRKTRKKRLNYKKNKNC